MKLRIVTVLAGALSTAGALAIAGCGSSGVRAAFEDPGAGAQPPVPNGSTATCSEFDCAPKCTGKTRLSGTVRDPAGKVPLYNAMVYVPSRPLEPIPRGVSCDRCGATAIGPRASALSDAKGRFSLELDAVGNEVEIVVQVGKWRRLVKTPIKACQDNELPSEATRLPRSQKEGDLPQFAIATGECDPLQCLLRRMGVDDSEFTSELGKGRVHLFQGTGGGKAKGGSGAASGLWGDATRLGKYDAVLLACECETWPMTKPPSARDALRDYAAAGGRLFGTHYQYYWLESGPPDFRGMATWSPDRNTPINGSYVVDTTFPKGLAFADWLVNVGASATAGRINLDQVKGDVLDVRGGSQRWIYDPAPLSTKYFTFNAPVGKPADQQCGRVTFSDIHVASGDETGQKEFPDGCETRDLNAQEKALEFFLFDLSSCVQPDNQVPVPPR